MRPVFGAVVAGSLLSVTIASPAAGAEDDVKRACVEASTSGQTLRKEEKLLAAREQMLLCARDACPSIVRSHCAKWLDEVEAQTPSVVLRAQGADGSDLGGARVSINGKPSKLDGRAVSLDPGEHVVVVERPDGTRKEEKVLLVEGEKSRLLVIRFSGAADGAEVAAGENAAASSAGPRPLIPTGAWILGGVSVAALGSFTYFALSAQSELDDLESTCAPRCSDDQTSAGRTKSVVANVSLAVSLSALAGAVLWTVLSHSGKSVRTTTVHPSLQMFVGGTVNGISGSF